MMKTFLKAFYVAVVALVVFTGALFIFEGARTREEKAGQTAAQREKTQPAGISDVLDAAEGSAL